MQANAGSREIAISYMNDLSCSVCNRPDYLTRVLQHYLEGIGVALGDISQPKRLRNGLAMKLLDLAVIF